MSMTSLESNYHIQGVICGRHGYRRVIRTYRGRFVSRTSSWESNDHIQGVICRGHGYRGVILTCRGDLCR